MQIGKIAKSLKWLISKSSFSQIHCTPLNWFMVEFLDKDSADKQNCEKRWNQINDGEKRGGGALGKYETQVWTDSCVTLRLFCIIMPPFVKTEVTFFLKKESESLIWMQFSLNSSRDPFYSPETHLKAFSSCYCVPTDSHGFRMKRCVLHLKPIVGLNVRSVCLLYGLIHMLFLWS